jgi:hypothetical protein
MMFRADPTQSTNPYEAPGSVDDGVNFIEVRPAGSPEPVGERTVQALAGTQTWVRLVGWLVLLIGIMFSLRVVASLMRIGQLGVGATWAAIFVIIVAGVYITSGILLFRYAGCIADFTTSRRVEHLDIALEAQRAFWRFLGISIAILFILLLGAILLFFLGAGAAGIWNLFR